MDIPVQDQEVDNSPDDKLQETEALEQAAQQGIYFVDHFTIVDTKTFQPVSAAFDTREEAEVELKKNFNEPRYTISQSREQIAPAPVPESISLSAPQEEEAATPVE